MKITKKQLQQIVKEEIETLQVEEGALGDIADYAKQLATPGKEIHRRVKAVKNAMDTLSDQLEFGDEFDVDLETTEHYLKLIDKARDNFSDALRGTGWGRKFFKKPKVLTAIRAATSHLAQIAGSVGNSEMQQQLEQEAIWAERAKEKAEDEEERLRIQRRDSKERHGSWKYDMCKERPWEKECGGPGDRDEWRDQWYSGPPIREGHGQERGEAYESISRKKLKRIVKEELQKLLKDNI